nr:hypothetical protein [Ktedonobacteraceae bacterium]
MDSSEILMQARSGPDAPHGWVVLPLLRSKLLTGMVGWVLGIVLGMGLFVSLAFIVIPYNYEHGAFAAIFSTILLGLLLFIGLGSLWALVVDARRLRQIDKHVIIITPDEFVKQEGDKVIHVPLMYVRNVTARGMAPPDHASSSATGRPDRFDAMPTAGENVMGVFAGRGFTPSGMQWRRKRMRTPTSLAFIDSRDDREVTVVTDGAYGDPFTIAALLKQYTRVAQDIA